MSDKLMASIFFILIFSLYVVGAYFNYIIGGIFVAIVFFILMYLFSGFLIWIVCLPDSWEWKEFPKLVFGWFPIIIKRVWLED